MQRDSRREAGWSGTDDRDTDASARIERRIHTERVAEHLIRRVLQRLKIGPEPQDHNGKSSRCHSEIVCCEHLASLFSVAVIKTEGHAVATHKITEFDPPR